MVAMIPIVFFDLLMLGVLVRDSFKQQLNQRYRNPRLKLVGINMDFNERILKRIYDSLVRY
ncbi:MAG: hypothetical protein CMH45_08265 [Muricauda sp.]|nr:hypothetical protein [Allomuricauda sp.]